MYKKQPDNSAKALWIVMILSVVLFVAAVGALFYTGAGRGSLPGPIERTLDFPGKILADDQVNTEIDGLRTKLRDIRSRWQSGEQKDSLLKQLDNVKYQLLDLKEKTSPAIKDKIHHLLDNTDEVMTGVNGQIKDVGSKFDQLIHDLEDLSYNLGLKNKESRTFTKEEEENEGSEVFD